MTGNEELRLNKYLADCGICSRREADRLIERGRVTVDGVTAQPGMKVNAVSEVKVGKKVIQPGNRKVVLAFYKPAGVTCTEKDKHAEKTIYDILNYPIRVAYAGRLDKDSEGLLLLTNDGFLNQEMMRSANGHEKEYLVKVDKEITDAFVNGMQSGVYLKELEVTTKECVVQPVGKFTFRIILTQGLNRQIRRMCQSFGYQVKQLKRIRVMNVMLGDLLPGAYRELSTEECAVLYKTAGLPYRKESKTPQQ